MSIVIEDNATDVLRKSMLGRGISSEMLAEKANVPLALIRRLRRERAESELCSRIAPFLKLSPEKLSLLDKKFDASRSGMMPDETRLPENCFRLEMFCGNKVLPEMTANAYVMADFERSHAVLVDCGMNAEALVGFLKSRSLKSADICLTHRHFDHAGGVKELTAAFPKMRIRDFNTCFVREEQSASFTFGRFCLRAIPVPGHTVDSVVFVWENPPQGRPPIAFTGDTVFLGSIGGCLPGYLEKSLASIKERLFDTLPAETILLPGHGPATTLEREIRENPFF